MKKRRPHIKLEFSSGIIQRKLFTDEGSLQISPDDCVIFNDGSKSEGCNLDHFKYYVSTCKNFLQTFFCFIFVSFLERNLFCLLCQKIFPSFITFKIFFTLCLNL